MSKEQKKALDQAANEFVQKVITEVYGQTASKRTVDATAKRVVATILPAKLAPR